MNLPKKVVCVNPRKELEKIIPYRLPKSRKGKIRMDLNESMKGCSPKVVEALRKVTHDHISRYPDYYTLQQKIAEYHQVHPDNILLTDGADEAIRCIIDAYLGKKDEILIPVPTFPMFEILARTRGATPVAVQYNTDLSFPVEAVLDAFTSNPKMVTIVNPGSPTGTLLQRKDLIKIIQKAKVHNTVVLLDEAYANFAGVTNVDLIKFTNLFVTRTFSKAFGLAGLRLGYAVSDRDNIEQLYKVRLPFCVNALTVIAGCAALNDLPYVENVVKETKREKEFLHNELKKMGIKSFMTNTNFLLVHLGEKCNNVHKALYDKGILVKNLEGAPLLTGWLRVTMGTHEDNTAFLAALKEVIPFQAILFDMDGVLVDERESYTLATKKTAEDFLDEVVDVKEIQQYKAKGGFNNNWDITEALITAKGKTVSKKTIIKTFQQYYRGENFDGFIQNEKWLLDLTVLKELKKSFNLGIVTGRLKEEALYTLERIGVKEYFDVIVTTDDVKKLKPDPYGIELALKTLQVNRAVYVGDTVDDAKAANNAGIPFIGISSGNKDLEESFANLGVKNVLETVNDLQKVV